MTKKRTGSIRVLGVETGATRTVALMEEFTDGESRGGRFSRELKLGPANLPSLDDQELIRHLEDIARGFPLPDAVAIGMAGARTTADRERIRRAAAAVWPGVPCCVTNDLETALVAADDLTDQPR